MLVTEAYVTLFDELERSDPTASRVSQLAPGRTIGLALKVGDSDDRRVPTIFAFPGSWGPQEHNSSISGSYDAIRFADAVLVGADGDGLLADEPSLTSDGWARIKASFADTVGRGRRR